VPQRRWAPLQQTLLSVRISSYLGTRKWTIQQRSVRFHTWDEMVPRPKIFVFQSLHLKVPWLYAVDVTIIGNLYYGAAGKTTMGNPSMCLPLHGNWWALAEVCTIWVHSSLRLFYVELKTFSFSYDSHIVVNVVRYIIIIVLRDSFWDAFRSLSSIII